jgi:hypothetical protein
MKDYVKTTVHRASMKTQDSDLLLLRHCLTLGGAGVRRAPAKARLEEAIGPELTRRLLASLTVSGRR